MWDSLSELLIKLEDVACILCGDFNEVRRVEERLNCDFVASRAARFNNFITTNGLIDLPLGGRKFTRVSEDGLKYSKLDRFLFNEAFNLMWHNLSPTRVFDEWLKLDDIESIINTSWNEELVKGPRLDCYFRNKLKRLKLLLKETCSKKFGQIDGEIETYKSIATNLECKAKNTPLSEGERKTWEDARRNWLEKERSKTNMLRQKSRVRWILEGDGNTTFFHSLLRHRYNKNNIIGISVNEIWIEEPNEIKTAVFGHFANIFECQNAERPSLEDLHYPSLTHDKANKLESPFTEDEIFEAVHDCGSSKAPGPDGFNMLFFKKFWKIIKSDLIAAIQWFWEKGEISRGCNASFITLVPKKVDPLGLGDYRPISLIRSFYKIIAKILSNRLIKVVPELVGSEQSAFIKGRFILDGALIANETLDFLKSSKQKGLIFKVDFEKASDYLNWDYLLDVMRCWGVHQGDPLSPFLFILAAEGLNILAKAAVDKGLFKGVEVGKEKVIISHLQYADDTIFFGNWKSSDACNLINLLKCFELSSGLKVNFNKSCLYGVGVPPSEVELMASRMGCKAGKLPFVYLGLPIGTRMNNVLAWQPVIDKFKSRLSDWKMRTTYFGGRLVLIKSVLSSLPLYFFSLFRAPPCVIKLRESVGRNFFWGGDLSGNLIEELQVNFKDSFVKTIGDGDSVSFWNDCWLGSSCFRDLYPRLFRLEARQNASVKDRLNAFTSAQHASLVAAAHVVSAAAGCSSSTVAAVNWEWVRPPAGRTLSELNSLMVLIRDVSLVSDKKDSWKWALASNGLFTVKALSSIIDEHILGNTPQPGEETCRNYLVPKKVELFIWRALIKRLPVRLELDKRDIDLHTVRCPLCDDGLESVDHSLILCSSAQEIWSRVFKWWNRGRFSCLSLKELLRDSASLSLIWKESCGLLLTLFGRTATIWSSIISVGTPRWLSAKFKPFRSIGSLASSKVQS
ncbi:uncharacterized protein [Rutidosis leptorrhynchoides]|uniref:uncharacterized protein n=1 Tax=Rutidosis leptorrhynchoides TaxID=125765 RepID=UPI003A9A5261